MPRPGVDVNIVEEFIPGQAVLATDQSFMIGITERGPVGETLALHSGKQYESVYGSRVIDAVLSDSAHSFFNEGGATLYVSRYAADGALSAEGDLGTGLVATAKGPGAWGNNLTVTLEAPGSTLRDAAKPLGPDDRVVVVEESGVVKERSIVVSTTDAAIAYVNAHSSLITLGPGADNVMPAVDTTVDLAGGDDDNTWDGATVRELLDVFTYALGPGQVSAPGHYDTDTHLAIGEHCDSHHRCGIVDLPNTNDPTVLAAAVGALYGQPGCNYLLPCGSWLNYPYSTAPATIVLPYSGMQSGLIALADKKGDPSIAAAGADGISRYALGLTQEYTDADRQDLNELGVCLGKNVYGQIRTYGYRTAGGPDEDNWLFFQESRVVMAIAHECDAAMEEYVFKTIDGRQHLLLKVNAALTGICQRYWQANALFGETAADAFRVDTGSAVNTIETIKAGEVHAQVLLKTSRLAEWIEVNLFKKSLESVL
jgi:hypothetical protein